jgi:hypothetical protein
VNLLPEGRRQEWRQRRHHRAFRVPPPPGHLALLEELAGVLAATEPASAPTPSASAAGTPPPPDGKRLAEAATGLWRAQRRLAGDDGRSAAGRQAGRYLRTCREALAASGLVVQDHDGDRFDAGRSIEVLAFEDRPSLTAETVLQTVRPTVYFHGSRIQMGQVIVGCPVAGADHEVRNDHA